jgi:tagatose-6-phosphate ketose/aldose isomerase
LIQGHVTDGLQALLGASEKEKEDRGTRYTPQEIQHQPATWQTTYKICAKRRLDLIQFLRTAGIGAEHMPRPTVFLVGAGTSDYIGRALTPLLRRLWGCEVWAVPSTDLLTNLEDFVFADRPYLWVSFSRSGDSSEGLAVLEKAIERYPKVRHLLVTCNQEGGMAAVCEKTPNSAFVLALDDTANDRGLAMTSSFTNMVVAGHCLAHVFSPNDYEPTFSVLRQAGRFLEGVFCGFGSAASRGARISPEAGGVDRRQDTDHVRVHARAASWPHVGAGREHGIRELRFPRPAPAEL